MYESPIKIIEQIADSFLDEFKRKEEEMVYTEIKRIGIDVDKEELIKALMYDREQYSKGYSDGYVKAIDEFAERLKERLVGMQMAELQGEDVCPCRETGEECKYMNQDIGCQYCAREHTIKDIDEITQEMRGAE